MRTRLAITTTLVLGLLLSTTGAGLAVSGIAGGGSAAGEEYPQQVVPGDQPDGEVLGDEPTSGGEEPEENGQGPSEEDAAQPTEQVAAPDDSGLPFTGLASIPLLHAGLGLLGFGVVLRRGARREPAH